MKRVKSTKARLTSTISLVGLCYDVTSNPTSCPLFLRPVRRNHSAAQVRTMSRTRSHRIRRESTRIASSIHICPLTADHASSVELRRPSQVTTVLPYLKPPVPTLFPYPLTVLLAHRLHPYLRQTPLRRCLLQAPHRVDASLLAGFGSLEVLM